MVLYLSTCTSVPSSIAFPRCVICFLVYWFPSPMYLLLCGPFLFRAFVSRLEHRWCSVLFFGFVLPSQVQVSRFHQSWGLYPLVNVFKNSGKSHFLVGKLTQFRLGHCQELSQQGKSHKIELNHHFPISSLYRLGHQELCLLVITGGYPCLLCPPSI